jgi:tetratricopeptide (TPR) repeat protein/DNA-binding winged helix-turn-helix (wHTH) protein
VPSQLRIGDAQIDLQERRVDTPRGAVRLTELEASLLRFLLERRGSTTSRSQLLDEVWGYHPRAYTRAVDHTVSRLRKKIEVDPRRPRWLTATRGGGYRLELPPVESPPLPEEPSSFVGRTEELEAMLAALDTHRVVALLGLGGVGKSRLALRLALRWHERRREAVLVPLGSASTRGEVRGRVAGALSVGTEQLRDALEGQEDLLVVLDEVERLPQGALDFVQGSGGARFLLASQRPEPLAEHTIEVGPLPPIDGVALLRARSPSPVSDADAQKLVEALDGLPFALELAARWLAAAPPADVLARLHELRGVGRHGSATAALLGSWDLLDGQARSLLGEAALFAAPFRIVDLEAVSGRADALAVCADLVARGWLVRTGDRLATAWLVRKFLRDQGAVPADGARRHALWLSSWAPAAHQEQNRRWTEATHERLTRAEPELRAALAEPALEPEVAVPLLGALYRMYGDGSLPFDAAQAEFDAVIERVGPDPGRAVWLQTFRAELALASGDFERAWACVERARASLSQHPGPHEQRLHEQCVLEGLTAKVLQARGQPEQAVAHYRSAIALAEGLGQRQAVGIYRMNLALQVARQDPPAAIAMLVEALSDLVEVGNPASIGRVHANLARLLRARGELEAGDSHQERAHLLLRQAGDRRALGQLLLNQAHHLLDLGEGEAARRAAEEALVLTKRLGMSQTAALATLTLAFVCLEESEPARALELALGARATLRRCGNPWTLAEACWCVGHAELALGRPDGAQEAFEAGEQAVRRAGSAATARFAAGLALARLASGDPAGAEALCPAGSHGAIVRAALQRGPLPELPPDCYLRILARSARRVSG